MDRLGKKQIIEATHLTDAWLKACAFVFRFGKECGHGKDKQKEAINLLMTIKNGFEMDHEKYFEYFGRTIYDKVLSIYNEGGSIDGQRNYAQKIYSYNGLNQVEAVASILLKDPTSRSATIVLADPKKDKYHFPCIMEVNFKIREAKLIMTVVFKSSDVAKKFIPDIFSLSKIHGYLSQKLHIVRGQIDIIIMSAQVYSEDYLKVSRLISSRYAATYFNEQKTIENWNKEARQWNRYIKDPKHYVNLENGYQRFLKFAEAILETRHLSSKAVALDSGCGTGVVAHFLKKHTARVYGIDIADKMIAEAKAGNRGVSFVLANCLDMPFKDNFFSAIVSRGVLISHVGKKYTSLFVKEANRTLTKNGILIFDFITHFNKGEEKKSRAKATFVKNSITKLLEDNGFEVKEYLGNKEQRVNSVFCIKK